MKIYSPELSAYKGALEFFQEISEAPGDMAIIIEVKIQHGNKSIVLRENISTSPRPVKQSVALLNSLGVQIDKHRVSLIKETTDENSVKNKKVITYFLQVSLSKNEFDLVCKNTLPNNTKTL